MKTNTPFRVYIMTALVSFGLMILFVICRMIAAEKWFEDVFLGLGSGGFASTIVALVIDIANTRKQNEENEIQFKRLTSDFDNACEELRTEFVIGAQEAFDIDDEKRTFFEWATMLLGDDSADERILREANYSLQQVMDIESHARKLLSDSRIHIDKKYFDDGFTQKLKKIQNCCLRVERERKRKNYKNCLGITKELINEIIAYKPMMAKIFEEPFNWEEE